MSASDESKEEAASLVLASCDGDSPVVRAGIAEALRPVAASDSDLLLLVEKPEDEVKDSVAVESPSCGGVKPVWNEDESEEEEAMFLKGLNKANYKTTCIGVDHGFSEGGRTCGQCE